MFSRFSPSSSRHSSTAQYKPSLSHMKIYLKHRFGEVGVRELKQSLLWDFAKILFVSLNLGILSLPTSLEQVPRICKFRDFHTSLVISVVKNLPWNVGSTSSIPGWGTKIPQATEQLRLHCSNYWMHVLRRPHATKTQPNKWFFRTHLHIYKPYRYYDAGNLYIGYPFRNTDLEWENEYSMWTPQALWPQTQGRLWQWKSFICYP